MFVHFQLMKLGTVLAKRLVNLFLVTGELGTFCHRSCPPSLDLSNPISIMRYTKLQKMFATTCDVHKPPKYTTQEDRLND